MRKMKLWMVLFLVAAGCGGDEPVLVVDAGASADAHIAADASHAFELCEFYRGRYSAYAAACGADGAAAANLEIERLSPTGCFGIVDVDERDLGECVASMESILLTCASPEDFSSAFKTGPCPLVRWVLR